MKAVANIREVSAKPKRAWEPGVLLRGVLGTDRVSS